VPSIPVQFLVRGVTIRSVGGDFSPEHNAMQYNPRKVTKNFVVPNACGRIPYEIDRSATSQLPVFLMGSHTDALLVIVKRTWKGHLFGLAHEVEFEIRDSFEPGYSLEQAPITCPCNVP
jgi:hypothetical protein